MSSGDRKRDGSVWTMLGVGLAAAAVGFFAGMMSSQTETIQDPAADRKSQAPNPAACQVATGDEPTCAVCLTNRQDCVLGPCNHVVCQECALALVNCPMCRTTISSRERLFMS
jgi:hypothetical protein